MQGRAWASIFMKKCIDVLVSEMQNGINFLDIGSEETCQLYDERSLVINGSGNQLLKQDSLEYGIILQEILWSDLVCQDNFYTNMNEMGNCIL